MASAIEPSIAQKLLVILVGIGGATCSGKTTLAKHLNSLLPDSFIVHQDDFAPPQELIPMHPVYNVQDWDDPKGAIDWPRMVSTLRKIKATGVIPPEHYSHDHLNEQKEVPIPRDIHDVWRATFESVQEQHAKKGEKVVWVLVDGFLMYWHQDVIDELDVRVFLRIPSAVLKQRRDERSGYHTAEGTFWRDPPHYWEQIVWPAYVKAHRDIFEGGDLERGQSTDKVPDLMLVEGLEQSMAEVVERVCVQLVETVR